MAKGSNLPPAPPLQSARHIGETLYEYVQRREGELIARIAATRGDLAALENELAHVQSARRQIGNLTDFGRTPLPPPSGEHHHTITAVAGDNHSHSFGVTIPNQPTIKEMIVKALWAGYREKGATQAEIRQFIKNAYGREIDRTSISPQIARLRDDHFIKQKGGEDNWRLTQAGLRYAAVLANQMGSLYGLVPESQKAPED
jgi:hypothetical protein